MRIILALCLLIALPHVSTAQGRKKTKNSNGSGTLFGHWGYNRSGYTKSNIRFKGTGYDFTMKESVAHDNPSPFSQDNYLNLKRLTVPQFNLRIGYYFKEHWAISIGYDHMKYIFADQNEVLMDGYIEPGLDTINFWEGFYNNYPVTTNRDNFHYENSDGLNYLRVELTRTDMLFGFGNQRQFAISSNLGVAAGGLLSFNDFTFAGQKDMRTISMSGYGVSAHAGLRFEFFRHVYIGTNIAGGLNHQLKVKTRPNDASAFARHAYGYYEANAVIGFLFYIRPVNGCDSCPIW